MVSHTSSGGSLMYSHVLRATTISLLGMLLLISSQRSPAAGGADDKSNGAGVDVAKELTAKTMTLQQTGLSLSQALKELASQTGNSVEDRRREKEEIKSLKLDLKNATFWQALDAIAKAADARISLYERDGKIALLDGPYQVAPVSYSGLFRIGIKELHVHHFLDSDTHY